MATGGSHPVRYCTRRFQRSPANPLVQNATFAAANFYLPQAHLDPFGQYTRLNYDSYNVLLAQTQDALGNTVVARNDYRFLQPAEVTDPNGNHVETAFDVLGMVVGIAVKGKVGTNGVSESGDSFVQFTADWRSRILMALSIAQIRSLQRGPAWECYHPNHL